MGLLKAAKDSISTLLADQWREYFYCETLPNDVLMRKGQKKVVEVRNSNTKASDNIISNGSIVAVNEGQCMIIVDQGAIVEVCAEAGEFVYDSSSEPSLFYGNLGTNVANSFKTFGRRFSFGGNTAKDQRVYFFNTKEIMGNLYGTPTPIDFHLVSPKTGMELEAVVKCNGQYSFKIVDPIIFYTQVCANVSSEFTKSSGDGAQMISLMKSELLTQLPMALAPIAAQGVLPYQLQGHVEEITENMKKCLTVAWTDRRGIEVTSMTISASVPEEYREKLNEWNENVMLRDPQNLQAIQGKAFAQFIGNSKMGSGEGGASPADAMMSMATMGMMNNMMGGNMMGNMMGGMNPQQAAPAQAPMQQMAAPVLGWTCSCGHADNRGKFCAECGSPKPAAAGWTCGCGTVNQGKFCSNCGTKKPSGAPLYKCDKCGWEPEDPANPPKFCPECGDPFDENDIR